ncbi:MAG: hypothetical protein WC560_10310 [Syntrophales bacterium]
MDKKLKKNLFYYAASALCAVIIISGTLLSGKYVTSLSDKLNQFQTLRINSIKMKVATQNMRTTSRSVLSIISPYLKQEEMEGAILTTIDSIKANMKDPDITVSDFKKSSNEIVLPLTISGQIHDYTSFVNHIGYLQSLFSPFFFIDTISISKSSDEKKDDVCFVINGLLKTQSLGT